jgi:hypothetical protein
VAFEAAAGAIADLVHEDTHMAKGQKKSGREVKKPKATKKPDAGVTSVLADRRTPPPARKTER